MKCSNRIKIYTGHKRAELALQKTKSMLWKSKTQPSTVQRKWSKLNMMRKVYTLNFLAHGETDTTLSMSSSNFQD